MTPSEELQKFITAELRADAVLAGLVGVGIYDNVPGDAIYPYLSYGPSDFAPDDSECVNGRVEGFQIDCWSEAQGAKAEAKRICEAVYDALHNASGELGTHALVSMEVVRVRVFPDADPLLTHGVVQIEAMLEQN